MSVRTAMRPLVFALLLACAGCASSGDRPPVRDRDGEFVYPAAALAARIEGDVKVRFDIDAQGRVGNVRVESAHPEGVFEAAALRYVRGWHYRPASVDGVATPLQNRTARVRFKLGETSDYP